MTAPESSRSVDRVIRLLQLLADGRSHSVSEVAAELDLARPVVYRMVAPLVEHSWVAKTDQGHLRLGIGLLALAQQIHPVLRRACLPHLRVLAEKVGATAHLTVADGHEALAIQVVEPSWPDFHVAYRVGARHPLNQGAAGRAILAARRGTGDMVTSDGELQPGAFGLSMALNIEGLEASVGVILLGKQPTEDIERAVRHATTAMKRALS